MKDHAIYVLTDDLDYAAFDADLFEGAALGLAEEYHAMGVLPLTLEHDRAEGHNRVVAFGDDWKTTPFPGPMPTAQDCCCEIAARMADGGAS